MKFRLYLSRSVGAALLALLSVLFGGASSFGSSYTLEGQDTGNATGWFPGNLTNWAELQYIPCRFRIDNGPVSNLAVTLSFPGITATTPGFDGFFNFTNTPNVVFVSPPVLSAPASGNWMYSFTINVTDGNTAAVYFMPRLAAGAHANVGSALKISPTPNSAGELQIHKPSAGPGLPDLAIVKTGPAFVPQGGTITYTLTYTNKATTTNIATGVQATDFLPPNIVVDPSTLPPNATLVGNTLEWDLGSVPTNSGGQFTFQAQVPLSTPIGTVVSNFVQILSAEDDANTLNNTSSWLTKVTNGCVLSVTTPPNDQAACAGGSATFIVAASGAGLTYQWYQGSTLLGGQTGNSLTVTNVGTANLGTYFVVVSDGCGNSVTNSANLTLNAPLIVTTPPSNATNCPNTTATFTVSTTGTGLAYQWYEGTNALTGQNGSTLTLTNITTANAGAYSVVVSDVCGNEVTNNAVLVVNQPVLVTTPPMNITNCPGTPASFTVSASGSGLTYQWYNATGPISNQTAATLNLGAASAANAGTYGVVVKDACGDSVSNSAVLVVNQTVLVTVPPSNLTNCPGTLASFTVTATGTGLSYIWFQGTTAIPGQNGPTLNLGAASAANAGAYAVIVTDACGNSVTDHAVLVVNQTVLVTLPPTNLTNCPGTPASFTVGATGTGLTYQWYNSTGMIPGQNGPTLSLGAASAANAGTYMVVVKDLCGNSATNSAVLVVNQPVLVTTPPSDQTDCPGIPASFTVIATGTGLSYQWYNSTGAISGQNGASLNLGPASSANAGTYSVVVSDICGDKVTNSVTLTVNTNVVVTIPPANSTNCPGTTASFSVTASGTGLTYQWYENTNLLAGQTSNTLTLTNVTATNADTYSVVVSDTCGGIVSNSAVLVVNQTVSVITPPGNVTACPGTPVSFTVSATGTGLTYQWYNSTGQISGQNGATLNLGPATAAIAGTYSVVVGDACGDQITNSATLTVNTDVLVMIPPSNSTNCPGTTASFNVLAIGTGLTYQWYENTNLLEDQTSNTLTITNVTATNADTYTVVVGDACGDLVSNSAVLVVNQTVSVITPPHDFTACPGTGAQFSINATGTGLSYQWYKDGVQLGQTSNTLILGGVSAADAGTYSVVVTDVCGDSVTNTAVLAVNQNVLVTMPPSNSTNCPGTDAKFTVSATGTGLTYQWYFGTNLLSTSNTLDLASVSATDAGTYTVVIGDSCGGMASNSAVLVVNQPVSVEPLPSVTENIGDTVTFTAVASGTGPFTYQWYKGTVALDGQTNSTLTLTNLQPIDAGTYSVTVMGACTTATSTGTGGVLTINMPPTVSIVYPTNGQVFVAPATFNVTAVASDPDGTVTNVEIFSSTNGVDFVLLSQTNNSPSSTVVSNLPVGSYTFKARATDNLGATADSEPVTVSVVPAEGPTVTVVGSMRLNVQDGFLWLTNVACNPELSLPGAMKVLIHGITNNTIQVVNATGTSNGVPFVETLGEIEPGQCWTNIIKFSDPYGVAFNPILSVQLIPGGIGTGPLPPPPGAPQDVLFQRMLTGGTFLIEFATTNGGTYYVQYKNSLTDPWTTVPQVFTGTGQHIQWLDSGPPLTDSLPSTSSSRFYRVLVGN